MNLCRHCHRSKPNRPRGLCWTCYYTPGVRQQYPSTSKFARRGVGDYDGESPRAPLPTSALPGTAEKVLVLMQRARMRVALWHPADAPMDLESRKLGIA
jgi:hypothetical protein